MELVFLLLINKGQFFFIGSRDKGVYIWGFRAFDDRLVSHKSI